MHADTTIRDFFQAHRPSGERAYPVALYNRNCRKLGNTWAAYMSIATDISHRYARSFSRKWGFRSYRYREFWRPLLKAGTSPHPETLIGEREHALMLELLDDIFMVRRCLTAGEIWNGTGPYDFEYDEEQARVPVPASLAPYGYLKGNTSPYNISESDDDFTIEYSSFPFSRYLKIVDLILKRYYGVTTRDTSPQPVAYFHQDGDCPRECADWIARRFKLKPSFGEKK